MLLGAGRGASIGRRLVRRVFVVFLVLEVVECVVVVSIVLARLVMRRGGMMTTSSGATTATTMVMTTATTTATGTIVGMMRARRVFGGRMMMMAVRAGRVMSRFGLASGAVRVLIPQLFNELVNVFVQLGRIWIRVFGFLF